MASVQSPAVRLAAPASAKGIWGTEEADDQLAVTHRFHVEVGGLSLGGWSKVSGLVVEFERKDVPQAGVNTYTAVLLGRPKCSPITLERAVTNDTEWTSTFNYLLTAMSKPEGIVAETHHQLSIKMLNAWGDLLRTLNFRNARPCKWEGPVLDSNSGRSAVATEKLTLVHDGFFPDGVLLT